MISEEYLEIVRELVKANGNSSPRAFIRDYHKLCDEFEAKALKVLQAILRTARRKFLIRFKVATFETLYKAEGDDVRQTIKTMLVASLAGASDELIASLSPLIDELAQSFSDSYAVKLDFNLINEKAVAYLRSHAENYFSQLADDQAQGIFDTVAEQMASKDGYTIKTIVDAIRSSFGSQKLYFPAGAGPRELDATAWATMTARTETARAASFSQKAMLQSVGMQTWQWNTQETGCDICDDNDGEIVNIGDAFPSGDTEPPAHPNCRCICTAVQDELASLGDDDS